VEIFRYFLSHIPYPELSHYEFWLFGDFGASDRAIACAKISKSMFSRSVQDLSLKCHSPHGVKHSYELKFFPAEPNLPPSHHQFFDLMEIDDQTARLTITIHKITGDIVYEQVI